MAIQDIQGMDNLVDINDLLSQSAVWKAISGSPSIGAANGRWGGKGLAMPTSSEIRIPTAAAGISSSVCGHIFIPENFTDYTFFRNSANSGSSTYNIRVLLKSDGAIEVRSSNDGDPSLVFPGGTIVGGKWYYFAIYWPWSTNGTAKIRINNTIATKVSNYQDSSSSLTYLFGATFGGVDVVFDDLVWGTGDLTDMPPQRIYHLKPNANRAAADFTVLGGGDGFDAVNEAVPDGDTSYIYSGTTGHISEFDFEDLPAGVTEVNAVSLVTSASREATGAATLNNSLHTSIGTSLGLSNQVVSDGVYSANRQVLSLTNPDTASSFTPAEVNGIYVKHEVAP